MYNLIKQFNEMLDKKDRFLFLGVFFLMVIGAFFELVGIGVILPFIALINDPSSVHSYKILEKLHFLLNEPNESQFIMFIAIIIGFVFLFKNIFIGFMKFVQFTMVYRAFLKTSTELLKSYLYVPYVFHLEHNSSELIRNIQIDTLKAYDNVLKPILTLWTEILVLGTIAIFLLILQPIVTITSIGIIGIVGGVFYRAIRSYSLAWGKLEQESIGKMLLWAQQGLGGIKEILVLQQQQFFLDHFMKEGSVFAHMNRNHKTSLEMPRLVIETIGFFTMLLATVLLMKHNNDKIIPILGLFAVASVRLLPAVTRIVNLLTYIRHSTPTVNVVYNHIMEVRNLRANLEKEIHFIGDNDQNIVLELKNISYQYPSSNKKVLKNLSLSIRKGESIGFVGVSGAGKTTIIDVLLGLLSPSEGSLCRAKNITIGYVPQSVYLSDDSIRANVAFGVKHEEISDSMVWKVLNKAQLQETCEKLPEGLNTFVGEAGVRLSGGQRQRIGIARALYHKPTILIFDEATSALDNQTELQISQAIEKLQGEKTLILIAHRLSTVKKCNRLFVLEEGQIIAEGTYEELLESCKSFQQMAFPKTKNA